jgi:D-proline reductase (dithiol) PrdB
MRQIPAEIRESKIPFSRAKFPPSVALLTSCGVYLKGDQPFDKDNPLGDPTTRQVPIDSAQKNIRVSHPHYDTSGVEQDVNICLPVAALRELEKAGKIAAIFPTAYTFMGYMRDFKLFAAHYAEEIANALQAAHVDVAILTPC